MICRGGRNEEGRDGRAAPGLRDRSWLKIDGDGADDPKISRKESILTWVRAEIVH